jgi:hypothetical protein
VRLVDDQGWFERVRVSPTSLEAVLGGTGLEGTRVELNGETWRASAQVSDDVKVSLPLPEGLPREPGCTSRETGTGWTTGRSASPSVKATWPVLV